VISGFQANDAVLMTPALFWDIKKHQVLFFLDVLTLKNGTDTLSRNVGKRQPFDAA
jgi:hypothetical protein